jgi:formylglycine-generating enzyme required for sulfatase activity
VNPDAQERCVQCSAPLPRIKIQGQAVSAPQAPRPGQGPGAGQLAPGQILAGRYTIAGLIGRGGMGCIYRVKDNTLNEEVALKTLLPQFVRDKMVVERFFNEARIARKLAHPNIVRVHDIGAADGMVYISMELVRGQSLRNMMERLPPGQRLPPTEILRIIDELCTALEYAHQYTIHRDIKPENIMVDEQRRVKLMDFGISKLMANTRMTGASVVMGTPFYMSPEQLRNSRDVDARADVFSVGVVLYETITGAVPTGVPKPPSQVVIGLPKKLDDIVGKCVEPDPAKRYQNAAELRAEIRSLRQEMETGGPPPGPAPTRRTTVSLPSNVIGWVLSAAGLAATVGALWWVEQQAKAAPVESATGAQATPAGDVLALATSARDKAQTLGGGQDMQRIMKDADVHWTRASEGGGPAEAEAALRGYLAVIMAQSLPEMTYIPGGTAEGGVFVPAFFMDKMEVTQGDFAAFCTANNWRDSCTSAGAYADLPAANLTYYDAQAYAASKGKQLPTTEQWSRAAQGDEGAARLYPWDGNATTDAAPAEEVNEDAADEIGDVQASPKANLDSGTPIPAREANADVTPLGCMHLLGNVAEWTRSTADGGSDAPDFSSTLIVRGGSYATGDATLASADSAAYGAFREDLGFRCVKEIPTSQGAVEALLQ